MGRDRNGGEIFPLASHEWVGKVLEAERKKTDQAYVASGGPGSQ